MSALALRPARADDAEFLFELWKAALGPYVVQTFGPWDEAARRSQFFATQKLEPHQVVELGPERIGWLHLESHAAEWKLNRLFLAPTHQGRGLGRRLMQDLLNEADASHSPIRLRVLRVNPARRFWERLGFRVTGESATHFFMERAPTPR